MKNHKALGVLFLWGGTLFAQTNQQVNYITPNNVQTKLNYYFSDISKSLITTGVLMDKSAGIVEPTNFNGTAACAIASTNDWYTLYKRIDGARTNTTFAVPSEATLFTDIYTQNAEDRVPLGIVFANYHQIKDGALATKLGSQ
ncbi:MAG: hypothetical protein MUE96_03220 [Bacteroidia bacterium]|jgi:hypothetical protein|nr:hypothetical protein [Bacteroidia bacterium]